MGATTPAAYTIGGTISGLAGSVVLRDNGGDDLVLSTNGTFTFATHVPDGGAYSVAVRTQPARQACTVTHGSGTVSGANVTTVAVACATNAYSIGGTISGLAGSVVLQDSGSDDLTLSANGSFTFATPVPDGGTYSVGVLTQPAGQTCLVTHGSGTVGGANVTAVAVTCAATSWCSSGSTTQVFSAAMHGCEAAGGAMVYANRAVLCAPGAHACTAAEWNSSRGSTAPSMNYWTGDNPLNYQSGVTGSCIVSTTLGTNVCTGGSMLVCPDGGACGMTGCGLDTTANQHFGGCSTSSGAGQPGLAQGTLCCAN